MKNRNNFLIIVVAILIATLFFQRKFEVDISMAKASSNDGISRRQLMSKVTADIHTSLKKSDEAQPHKIIRANDSSINLLAPEKKDLICKLKFAHTIVPIQGDVQIFVDRMLPFFGNDKDNLAWIKSDSCPSGTYSIIRFSDDGRVSQEIDCRSTTLTEIATMSGEQGNIDNAPAKIGETSLAITGNGYFVLTCPNKGLILTRDGKFQKGSDGDLVNKDGCTLLNQNGSAFHNIDLKKSGCNSNGDCIATIDPSSDEVYGLEYINNYSFSADDVGQLTESVTKKGDKHLHPSFLVNALEDIHNTERGLTSVSWSNHPLLNLDEIECP